MRSDHESASPLTNPTRQATHLDHRAETCIAGEKVSVIATTLAFVGTLVAGALAILPVGTGPVFFRRQPLELIIARLEEVTALQAQRFDSIRAQIVALRPQVLADLDSIISARGRDVGTAARIGLIRGQQSVLDQRLKRMEDVVLADPAKALDLVLLRREFQADREANAALVGAVRRDVDRVYDLSKWIIGLMFTMSIGVLSLAAASIFKDRARQANQQ